MTKIDSILYEALINEGRLGREILEPLAGEAQAQGSLWLLYCLGEGLSRSKIS